MESSIHRRIQVGFAPAVSNVAPKHIENGVWYIYPLHKIYKNLGIILFSPIFFHDPLEKEEGEDNISNKSSNSEVIAEDEVIDGAIAFEVNKEVKQPIVKARKRSRLQHISAAVKELSDLNKTLPAPPLFHT